MTSLSDTAETRQAIIDACRWMINRGINQGTSGNISVRVADGMLITPSGIPYDALQPDMIVLMPIEQDPDLTGRLKPSSEWRFHQTLMRTRQDRQVLVHATPPRDGCSQAGPAGSYAQKLVTA